MKSSGVGASRAFRHSIHQNHPLLEGTAQLLSFALAMALGCVGSACTPSRGATCVAGEISVPGGASPGALLEAQPSHAAKPRFIPEGVAPRTPLACEFQGGYFSGTVFLDPAGPALAEVSARLEKASVPEGDASEPALLQLQLAYGRLNALISGRQLELHLRKMKLFQGYLWAGKSAALELLRANGNRLTYRPKLAAQIVSDVSLDSEAACDELSTMAPDNEVLNWSQVVGTKKAPLVASWASQASVPLSLVPGGTPVAHLRPLVASGDDDTEGIVREREGDDQGHAYESKSFSDTDDVVVLERRGNYQRIAYQIESFVVVGWVPMTSLRSEGERIELIDVTPSVDSDDTLAPWRPWDGNAPKGCSQPDAASSSTLLCAWNAPLAAEIGGRWLTVGSLTPAVPLAVGAIRDGYREVTLCFGDFTATRDAKLWVPSELLYPCVSRLPVSVSAMPGEPAAY